MSTLDRTTQLTQDLGARVDDVTVVDIPGSRAVLNARLVFQGEVVSVVLKVFEEIRLIDGRPHRFRYAYDVREERRLVFRFDRDPIAHPENPEHRHVAGRRKRFPCERVTLHVVAEKILGVHQ